MSRRNRTATLLLALPIAGTISAHGQTFDVSAHVEVVRHSAQTPRPGSAEVVIWLGPLDATASDVAPQKAQNYTLTQKDKEFLPHLLVVPVGSKVDFPNLDPFFHNVFSLFNGKRFDLGLYEGHSRRSVQFDREGVSFIFCNIHPDMGAIVVSLGTPYYAVSSADGSVAIHGVPRGRYRLNVWAENVTADRLSEFNRIIEVGPQNLQIGTLRLETSGNSMSHHTNKFGEPYKPLPQQPY